MAQGHLIAWMVQRPAGEAEFVVAIRFGPRTIASFEELLATLDVIGEPSGWVLTPFRERPRLLTLRARLGNSCEINVRSEPRR